MLKRFGAGWSEIESGWVNDLRRTANHTLAVRAVHVVLQHLCADDVFPRYLRCGLSAAASATIRCAVLLGALAQIHTDLFALGEEDARWRGGGKSLRRC